MAEDRLRILEERLTRIEAALSQRPAATGGFTQPGGVVVDPAPWGGGGWGLHPRPFPSPVVDPAPWPWGGGWGHPHWPTPVVDPAPWPTPVVDPAPWGGGFARPSVATFARIGHVGDPPPIDLSRLSISQLESALHTINAERARLDSMETMVKQQLERARQQSQG
jgi:hypothetical protein